MDCHLIGSRPRHFSLKAWLNCIEGSRSLPLVAIHEVEVRVIGEGVGVIGVLVGVGVGAGVDDIACICRLRDVTDSFNISLYFFVTASVPGGS